jgi:hypothetical protein
VEARGEFNVEFEEGNVHVHKFEVNDSLIDILLNCALSAVFKEKLDKAVH